jgi:DNA-binding transcriptional MerR regulator
LTARSQSGENRGLMRYLTTLEVARELNVSKQTLLNWLYAKKVPEPPRNKNGHRLWSTARVSLVRQLIREGRLHQRTVVHREPVDDPVVVLEVAREVSQFLKDAQIPLRRFVRELNQVHARARPKSAVTARRRGFLSRGDRARA